MEQAVTKLVDEFEHGRLSRRGLIRGLTAVAAAGAAAEARAQETPFESTAIDHISVQVEDLAPSIEFYQTIFGLSILNQDEPNKIVRMGPAGGRVIVSLHEKPPTGIVDHYAIAIRDFDQRAVTNALAAHGLEARQNLDYGFYVRDPAGIPVQIVGAR
ncbi:MAG: VOC family protein [Gammaproteobacteria bacterium]|jgi:catechol 2,3-dioxygenase-like lactoylglutathione lyase family enzyme